MGYIMERAALVDRMFHSVQLAFRRVPASLAVTTLLVCAFWGIASGIVGAVVVLMGVIALRPMLNAGYDVRLASGAITAGGTLGILIPPSVMLIVYAAVAGQSIVKLYAAAMLPGFFLTFLYLIYILGWAIINPKIAPKLSPDQYRVAVPECLRRLERGRTKRVVGGLIAAVFRPGLLRGATTPDGRPVGYRLILNNVLALMVPAALTVATLGATWWYVLIYNAPAAQTASTPPIAAAPAPTSVPQPMAPAPTEAEAAGARAGGDRGGGTEAPRGADAPPEEMTTLGESTAQSHGRQSPRALLSVVLGVGCVVRALILSIYFRRMDGEQFEILKELCASVVPLGSAHHRGARGDLVRHLHRDRVGGGGGPRGAVPGSVMAKYPTAGLVVESRRRDRRRRARLGARGFCGVAGVGIPRRHVLGDSSYRGS